MSRSLHVLASGLVAALMSTGITATTPAQAHTHHPSAPSPTATHDGRFVVVADPAASTLYVYPANGHQLTGKLTGVTLGTHAGTITLPDGRLALVDDTAGMVRFLRISAAGVPRIVRSLIIPTAATWARAAWMSVDRNFSYLAFSSDYEGTVEQTVTVVALDDYSVHQISVPLNKIDGGYQEAQVYLAGRPLQIVVTVGNEFRATRSRPS